MVFSPVLLPELVEIISQYLFQLDLLACALTCRSWNTLFIPELYRHIYSFTDLTTLYGAVINSSGAEPLESLLMPLWGGFQRYGHHIRTLDFECSNVFPNPVLLGLQCKNLRKLSVSTKRRDLGRGDLIFVGWSATVIQLLEHNPNINTLDLTFKMYNFQRDICWRVNDCTLFDRPLRLNNLYVNGFIFRDKRAIRWISEMGEHLHTLEYVILVTDYRRSCRGNGIEKNTEQEQQQERPMWMKLKTLFIYDLFDTGTQHFVAQSPCLERLTLMLQKAPETLLGMLRTLVEHITVRHFPSQLTHLVLSGLVGPALQQAFVDLMVATGDTAVGRVRLIYLRLNETECSPAILKTLLQYHGSTLKVLVIDRSNPAPSSLTIAAFLQGFRGLQRFLMPRQSHISVEDLIQQPWKSEARLRELEIFVVERVGLDRKEEEEIMKQRDMFWEQIGRSTNLERLALDGDINVANIDVTIALARAAAGATNRDLGEGVSVTVRAVPLERYGCEQLKKLKSFQYLRIGIEGELLSVEDETWLRESMPWLTIERRQ